MSNSELGLYRNQEGYDPTVQAQTWLEASQILIRQGKMDEARSVLRVAVQAEPGNTDALLRLVWLTEDQTERSALLKQVLAQDPDNVQAQAELARPQPPSEPQADATAGQQVEAVDPKTIQTPIALSPPQQEIEPPAQVIDEADTQTPAGLPLQEQWPDPPVQADGASVQADGASVQADGASVQADGASVQADEALVQAGEAGKGRAWRWVLGGLTVVALLLAGLLIVGLYLVLGPVDSSLARLVATPTATPIPTPTLTPGETAAQFEPQLQVALSEENWDRALELVEIMNSVHPKGDVVRQSALQTHMQYGWSLVEAEEMDLAQDQFDQAVAWMPQDTEARLWQQTTRHYRDGLAALQIGEWEMAVASLTQAHLRMPDRADVFSHLMEAYIGWGQEAVDAEDWTLAIRVASQASKLAPDDPEVVDLMALAYRQRGIVKQEQDQLQEARGDLETALLLKPDDEEAKTHLDEVMYILFPPKRIEISISRQRFYAYQGDTLVYQFVTSTGLRGRDTATGHFKVQSKIPNAYSSIWRLHMPYWLGIYYVGNIENGIHALPIRLDGSVMWGGLLGQRASYGCVILSTAAARTIYNWAEIGTEVWIYY
jgi:tetratricopeptide (TPR) repeat protein